MSTLYELPQPVALITHLRNVSKACTTGFEVSLSIKEVREIVGMLDEQYRLERAVKDIAKQKLRTEMEDEPLEGCVADWEHGYECCVRVARAALAPPSEVAEFVGLENTPKPGGQ